MQNPLTYKYFTTHDSIKIRYGFTDINKENSKGLVLLLHGRAEFMEKYKEIILSLNNKGYDVISFDWRGQGLSTRQLQNRHKGYVKNFNDYLIDLKIFFDKIVIKRNQSVFLLSHSMGGHIGLRFLHDYPHLIKKAVFVSPMFNIKTFPFSKIITKAITKVACTTGFSEHFVFGGKKYDSMRSNHKKNIFSHDLAKFSIQANEIEKNPDLAIGGVTWAWLNAAYNSIDILLKNNYVQTINTPVLIVNAQKDKLVKRSSQKAICNSLPYSSFVSIKNSFHEILFENQDIRKIFWEHFDKFIDLS